MKKRVIGSLAALAALVALPALVYLSAKRSAAHALRRHAADLDRLETRFRERAARRPCAFDDPRPDPSEPFLARAAAAVHARPDLPMEEVVEALREALRRPPPTHIPLISDYDPTPDRVADILIWRATIFGREGRSAEAFDALLLLLGYAQDQAWGRGDLAALRVKEYRVFEEARKVLKGHTLTAARIEHVLSRLDRLELSRPTALDELDLSERKMKRDALGLVPKNGVDEPYRPRAPGWRTFWCWTIAHAAYLTEIEEFHRRHREFAALPAWERWPASEAYLRTLVGRFVDAESSFGYRHDSLEWLETEAAAGRALLRAALAVAKDEIEKGRFPTTVPGAPLAPDRGKPYEVRDGAVLSGERSIHLERRTR